MLEFCSCGAQLAPDSLFCHKCGKPQREVIEAEEPEVIPEVVVETPVAPPAPAPLNFHNPIAVRVAFTVALVATLLSWIPALNVILWVAAGFSAVYLYRRRTGVFLNVRAGVRMGWITGVLMFVITTVIFTVTVLPAAANGGIAALFRQQFKNASDPNVQEALRMLETGPGIATILLATLFMLFCFITLLAMAGGALGAKLVGSTH
jgi:hypothetical protein